VYPTPLLLRADLRVVSPPFGGFTPVKPPFPNLVALMFQWGPPRKFKLMNGLSYHPPCPRRSPRFLSNICYALFFTSFYFFFSGRLLTAFTPCPLCFFHPFVRTGARVLDPASSRPYSRFTLPGLDDEANFLIMFPHSFFPGYTFWMTTPSSFDLGNGLSRVLKATFSLIVHCDHSHVWPHQATPRE